MSKESTSKKKSKSVYAPTPELAAEETHILAVLVNNEPGVLARIVGFYSGRGYNIESLTVAETNHDEHLSRITIACKGTPAVIDQIKAQLQRLVPVLKVSDLTIEGRYIERELALLKIVCTGDQRADAQRDADAFCARTVDSTPNSFIFEATDTASRIDDFIAIMKPHGLVDVSRTGIAAISKGDRVIGE